MTLLEHAIRRSKFTPYPIKPLPRPIVVEACPPESVLIPAHHQWGAWVAPEKYTPPLPKSKGAREHTGLVTIDEIKDLVRYRYKIREPQLIGACREQPYMRIRQIAMYLCCLYTGKSLPKIGAAFGGRDHTTVLSNRERIKNLRYKEGGLENALRELEDQLYE